jgi:Zn-dependent membrane protease YugP
MFIDPSYIIFVLLPTLVLSGLASLYVRSAYKKWSQRGNSSGVTGVETARQLMRQYNLSVSLEGTDQQLGDHFDPRSEIVRLSPGVANQPSVAAMAIAAHEFGHVQQYADDSILIAARSVVLPVAQFGSGASYFLILIGVLTNLTGLAWLGVLLFGAAVLFSVLTLPIEIDASRRAMKMLEGAGLIQTAEDRSGARAVLIAAASTYLAAMVTSLLTLAYYAMLVTGASRD